MAGGPTYTSTVPAYLIREHVRLITGQEPETTIDSNGVWVLDDSPSVPPDDLPVVAAFTLRDILDAAIAGGNPYSAAAAYDPTDALSSIDSAIISFNELWESHDPATEWGDSIDSIVAKADTIFTSAAWTAARYAALAARLNLNHTMALNRLCGPLVTQDAVEGTTYALGVAHLEKQRSIDLADAQETLELGDSKVRGQFIASVLPTLLQMHVQKRQAAQVVLENLTNYYLRTIVAGKEFIQEDLSYAVESSIWDLKLLREGAAVFGALNGAPQFQTQRTPIMTQIAQGVGAFTSVGSMAMGGISSLLSAAGGVAGGLAPLIGMI